jgi:hypothetical protein
MDVIWLGFAIELQQDLFGGTLSQRHPGRGCLGSFDRVDFRFAIATHVEGPNDQAGQVKEQK